MAAPSALPLIAPFEGATESLATQDGVSVGRDRYLRKEVVQSEIQGEEGGGTDVIVEGPGRSQAGADIGAMLPSWSVVLFHPDDEAYLSELMCIVRKQVEVFVRPLNKGEKTKEKDKAAVDPQAELLDGKVGLRCVHCRGGLRQTRAGAVVYPNSRALVYQSVRNYQRRHMLSCPSMPPEVHKAIVALKSKVWQKRSKNQTEAYWVKSCDRLGMVDTEDGLRLRRAVIDGTWKNETGREAVARGSEEASAPMSSLLTGVAGTNENSASPDLFKSFVSSEPVRGSKRPIQSKELPLSNDEPCFFDLDNVSQSSIVPSSLDPALELSDSIGEGNRVPIRTSSISPRSHDDSCSVLNSRNDDKEECHSLRSELEFVGQSIVSDHDSLPTPQVPNLPQQCAFTKEMILQRVSLARAVVQAAAGIRQLPTDEGNTASSNGLCSLGADLYELFVGQRPFDPGRVGLVEDDSERCSERQRRWKRGRQKVGGQSFVPLKECGLPFALCNLVSSLLETENDSADDHESYNSIEELLEDLEIMVNNPEKFLFGSEPSEPVQLQNSQGDLHGREEEISRLLEAFDHVTAWAHPGSNRSMVLISGYTGTGKSSLVYKVGSQFVEKGARFISSKFDAMRQMQPLSGIMSALNEYCTLLANDRSEINQVKTSIMAAVGSEGRTLAEWLPNLQKIIPDIFLGSPQSAQVSGRKAQRLQLLRALLRATCSAQSHPLVLFLDDLQWADEASLELMAALVTDSQLDGLLLIGSYRDDEVGENHPLLKYLEDIRRSRQVEINQLHIGNLGIESVNALVSNALRALPRRTRPLSRVILSKTGGNPLFMVQFLVSLHDEGLLHFALASRRWEWDIGKIREKEISENVAELMTAKLLRLAPEVHDALKMVAAFGSHCQKAVLQIIDADPSRVQNTVAALDVAVAEGLMTNKDSTYHFSHDQIQSAAYALIPESERESFHLDVGRSLWQQSSNEQIDTHLFILVDQMHRGAGLVSDNDERIALAQLSLTAGEKAASMSAFLPASAYLKSAADLIVENDWKDYRDLCLDIHNLCAEMDHICGKSVQMKGFLNKVLQRAASPREKVRAYYTLVQFNGSQFNAAEAFDTAITALDILGEALPSDASHSKIQMELWRTQTLLSAKTEEELLELEVMCNPDKMEAMRFYNILLLFSYTQVREYFPLLACRMVQLSLSYGVCRESAMGFAAHGMVICGLMNDIAGAYRFGKVALSILERFQCRETLARVNCLVFGFINNWVEPLQSSLPCIKKSIEVGLSCGDNDYVMIFANLYVGDALLSGQKLSALMDEATVHRNRALELKQNLAYTFGKPIRQTIANLLGKAANPLKLVGEEFDEKTLQNNNEDEKIRYTAYFYAMWLQYLFGEYELAAETAAKNGAFETTFMSRFCIVCNHVFYSGLAALALARKEGRGKWIGSINRAMAQMRGWTRSAQWNCQHKMELMIAEYAFLEGDNVTAAESYRRSAATAEKRRFVHEQGLALERAGIFFLETGDHAAASEHFLKAHDCYTHWEAYAKAAHIKERYTLAV